MQLIGHVTWILNFSRISSLEVEFAAYLGNHSVRTLGHEVGSEGVSFTPLCISNSDSSLHYVPVCEQKINMSKRTPILQRFWKPLALIKLNSTTPGPHIRSHFLSFLEQVLSEMSCKQRRCVPESLQARRAEGKIITCTVKFQQFVFCNVCRWWFLIGCHVKQPHKGLGTFF